MQALLIFCVIGPLAAMWNGYVTTVLWSWFVVPTFGLAPLPLAVAIGLSLLVGHVTQKLENKPEEHDWAHQVAQAFVYPVMALLIGYIAHLFV